MYKLSEEFLNKYKNKQPNWGVLGFITYKRTYARRIEEENRTEEWWETVRRATEGNFNLIEDPRPYDEVIKEMELTYDLIYNFAFTPPGRGLWVSGTEYSKNVGDSLINCFFIAVRPQSYISGKPKKVSMPFIFLFDQSMKGGGVGFSVENKNVNKIPKVKNYVNLTIVCNYKHKDFNDMAGLVVTQKPEKHDIYYRVEDSRQGWCESFKYVIDEHWNPKKKVVNLVIDISDIRPQGDLIKGFGGKASGPKPLVELLQFVNGLINSRITGKLSPIDCVDIMNFIGRTVVAGNIRRTSEIALADPHNIDFINMKNWRIPAKLDDEEKRKELSDEDIATLELMKELQLSHRWASNNSIVIDNKFNCFQKIVEGINSNGEPGLFNLFMAQNFGRVIDGYNPNADPNVEGQNPCFTGDTKIITIEGQKTYEELIDKEVYVLSSDDENSVVYNKMYNIRKTKENAEVLKITLSDNTVLKCTPQHNLFLKNKNKVNAQQLKIGDTLFGINDNIYIVEIEKLNELYDVYNGTVENTHNYFVKCNGGEIILSANCGEITLENGGCCNLVEVFPYICDKLNIPYELVLDLALKYAKRVTFANYEWECTRNVVYKTRRIGVGLSGVIDWFISKFKDIIIGWEKDEYGYEWAIFNEEIIQTLDNMYKSLVESDKKYSKLLNCEESIKKSTNKPSGTLSLLPGLSPGIHFHYSDYYIRRIRFRDDDSLLEVLKQCGYDMEKDISSPNTTVVEFPVKVPTVDFKNFKSCEDITIEEQFAIQALMQGYWADNSVSCTITFKEEEKNKIIDLLKQYKNIIKSTSLLPYTEHGYKQAPYEPITKEEYERRIKLIKAKPEDIMKIDNSSIIELEDYDECKSGHCPIK